MKCPNCGSEIERHCPYCEHRKAWVWNRDETILIPWKCNYCLNKCVGLPCFEHKRGHDKKVGGEK